MRSRSYGADRQKPGRHPAFHLHHLVVAGLGVRVQVDAGLVGAGASDQAQAAESVQRDDRRGPSDPLLTTLFLNPRGSTANVLDGKAFNLAFKDRNESAIEQLMIRPDEVPPTFFS